MVLTGMQATSDIHQDSLLSVVIKSIEMDTRTSLLAKLEASSKENAALRAAAVVAQNTIASLNNDLNKLRADLKDRTDECKTLQTTGSTRIRQLEADCEDQVKKTRLSLADDISKLVSENSKLVKELAALKKDAPTGPRGRGAGGDSDATNKRIANLRSELNEIKDALEESEKNRLNERKEKLGVIQQMVKLTEQKALAEKQRDELNARDMVSNENKVKQLQATLSGLHDELRSQRTGRERKLADVLEQHMDELVKLQEKGLGPKEEVLHKQVEELLGEVKVINAKMEETSSRVSTLIEEKEKLLYDVNISKEMLEKKDKECYDLQEKISGLTQEKDVLDNDLNGMRQKHSIMEIILQAAQTEVGLLSGNGPSSTVQTTSVSTANVDAVASLKGEYERQLDARTKEISDLQERLPQLALKASEMERDLQSIKKLTVAKEQTISDMENSLRQTAQTVSALESSKEMLEAKLDVMNKEKVQLDRALKILEDHVADLQKGQSSQAQSASLVEAAEVQRLQSALTRANADVESFSSRLAESEKALHTAREDTVKMRQQLAVLEERERSLAVEMSKTDEHRTEQMKALQQKLNGSHEDSRTKIQSLETDISVLKEALSRSEQQCAKLEDSLNELTKSNKTEIEDMKQKLVDAKCRLAEAAELEKTRSGQMSQLEMVNRTLSDQLTASTNIINTVSMEEKRVSSELNNAQSEILLLHRQLAESKLELDRATAEAIRLLESVKQSQKQLKRVQKGQSKRSDDVTDILHSYLNASINTFSSLAVSPSFSLLPHHVQKRMRGVTLIPMGVDSSQPSASETIKVKADAGLMAQRALLDYLAGSKKPRIGEDRSFVVDNQLVLWLQNVHGKLRSMNTSVAAVDLVHHFLEDLRLQVDQMKLYFRHLVKVTLLRVKNELLEFVDGLTSRLDWGPRLGGPSIPDPRSHEMYRPERARRHISNRLL